MGPKISQEEWEKGIAEAHKSPERFQRQDVLGLSRVEDNLTDMRSMAYVLGEQTIISQTKWSRGIPLAGDGKVNLSASGFEYIVMVVKDPLRPGRRPAKMRAPRKIYCQVFFQPSL